MVEWLQAGGWPAWVVTGVGACAIGASLAYAIRPRLATLVGALVLVALTFAMGLLGTILGLMAAFRAVSTADPSEKASMLAGGISTSMHATAIGIGAAMVCVVPLVVGLVRHLGEKR